MKALTVFVVLLISAYAHSYSLKGAQLKNLSAIAFENPDVHKSVLFVHGTPGSTDAFSYYVNDADLRSKASLIAVDRIGFGKSSGLAETKLEVHSKSVLQTLDSSFQTEDAICVGHSYGATVCLDLAARFPERFGRVVLIAGAFNPHRKILRWYNYIAAAWPFRVLLSRALTNSNKEMYALKSELLDLESRLDKVQASVQIIHGRKDKIVPYEDAAWLLAQLKKHNVDVSLKTYESDGHFIIWKKEESIKKDLLSLI